MHTISMPLTYRLGRKAEFDILILTDGQLTDAPPNFDPPDQAIVEVHDPALRSDDVRKVTVRARGVGTVRISAAVSTPSGVSLGLQEVEITVTPAVEATFFKFAFSPLRFEHPY